MIQDLGEFVDRFSAALMDADAKHPQAVNVRSKVPFQPGIGPHTEAATVELVMNELDPSHQWKTGVPYPELKRQKCDICLGSGSNWAWAIEVKMIRFLGDNGKVNDNILMHVLSPYPADRSALTDCGKLIGSSLALRKAIVTYGYDHADWQLDPAVEAFEVLARHKHELGPRHVASFRGLIHPVHREGRVFGWELIGR